MPTSVVALSIEVLTAPPRRTIEAAMAAGLGGVVVHLVPLFRDLGADHLAAAGTATFVGLSSVVGRLGIGLLLDRFPAELVSLDVLTLAALGIGLMRLDEIGSASCRGRVCQTV